MYDLKMYGLKFDSQRFIFVREELIALLHFVFQQNWVLFQEYADTNEQQKPITSIEDIIFPNFRGSNSYRIVPYDFVETVKWDTIHLFNGGIRYAFFPFGYNIRIVLPPQTESNVENGSIEYCKEWEEELGGERITAPEVTMLMYKQMKNAIRRMSQGTVTGVLIGIDTYRRWYLNQISLYYWHWETPIDKELFRHIKKFKPIQ